MGLIEQDLGKLDMTKLYPPSPEVTSQQATINIGNTFSHVCGTYVSNLLQQQ